METLLVVIASVMLIGIGVTSLFVGFSITLESPLAAILVVAMGVALMAVGFTFIEGLVR